MKNFQIATIISLLLLLFIPQKASADYLILCNDCTTTTNMQNIMDHYGNSRTNKTYIVKDLKRKIIEKYVVMWEPEIGMGIPTSAPVSTARKNLFARNSADFDFLDVINGVPYESGTSLNAFDVRFVPALEVNVINDYKNNSHWYRRFNDTLSSVFAGFTVAKVNMSIQGYTFDIKLSDDTKAVVQIIGFENGSFTPKYEIVQFVDANDNVIPELNTNGKVVFRFTTVENFLLWLNYMGQAFGLSMSDFEISWVRSHIPNGSIVVTELPTDGEPTTPNIPKDPEEDPEEE